MTDDDMLVGLGCWVVGLIALAATAAVGAAKGAGLSWEQVLGVTLLITLVFLLARFGRHDPPSHWL